MIAIQGIRGSYSEEAARKIGGAAAEILECADFEQTFQKVLEREAKYAVVPLENKIVGAIKAAKNLFDNSNLQIFDELILPVRHKLIGTPNADLKLVRAVYSHVEALKQCRRFLSANPEWKLVGAADTASGVKRIVAENDAAQAAIGSERAAEIYGGKIIREDIADETDNWTKFFLIGNRE